MVISISVLFQLRLTCGIGVDESSGKDFVRETIGKLFRFHTVQMSLALGLDHAPLGIIGIHCLEHLPAGDRAQDTIVTLCGAIRAPQGSLVNREVARAHRINMSI